MADQWHVRRGDRKSGPFSSEQIRQLAASGLLLPTDFVWQQGLPADVPASKVKGLFPQATANQASSQTASPPGATSRVSSPGSSDSPQAAAPVGAESEANEIFDCPNCGEAMSGHLGGNQDLRCRKCGIFFSPSEALNVRRTPERVESHGLLGRLWNGSSIQLSRREMIERQLAACKKQLGLSQVLKSMATTNRDFLEANYHSSERHRLEDQVRELQSELEQFENNDYHDEPSSSTIPAIRVVGRFAEVLDFSQWTFDGSRLLRSVMSYLSKPGFPKTLRSNGLTCRLFGPDSILLEETHLKAPNVRPGGRVEAMIRVRDLTRIERIEIEYDDDDGGRGEYDGRGPCKSCGVVFDMKFDAATCPKCGSLMSRDEAFASASSYSGQSSQLFGEVADVGPVMTLEVVQTLETNGEPLEVEPPSTHDRNVLRGELTNQIAALRSSRTTLSFTKWYSIKFGPYLNREPPFDSVPLAKLLPSFLYKLIATVVLWYLGCAWVWIPLWYTLTKGGMERTLNAEIDAKMRLLQHELIRL